MPSMSTLCQGFQVRSFRLLNLAVLGVLALACSDDGPSEPEFAADLEASVLLDGQARVGEEVRVLVRVENNGPHVATQVSIGLDLPADVNVTQVENQGTMEEGSVTWSIGALEPVQLRVVGVHILLESPRELTFTGRASSTIHDPDPTNNSEIPFGVEVMPITETDLVVDLHAAETVVPGGELEYRVVTRNSGLIPAESVVARLELESQPEVLEISDGGAAGAGTVEWPPVPSLAAGDSLVRTVRVRMSYTSMMESRASAETATDESLFSNSNGTAPHSRSTTFPALELLDRFTGGGSISTMEVGGDLDGDGTPDLVAAAMLAAEGAGVVYALNPLTGETIWSATGNQDPGRLGFALAVGSDVDGDGVPDVLAGGPGQIGEPGQGILLSGADGSVVFEIDGLQDGELLGLSAAFVGDLDGDGRAEMALGAPRAEVQGDTTGVIRIFSSRDGALLVTLEPEPDVSSFGLPMLSPGDLDGDGTDDLFVGASDGYRGLSVPSGEVLFGPVAGEAALADYLRMAPDLNGDGSPEILVPVPFGGGGVGQTWFLSTTGSIVEVLQGEGSNSGFGRASGVGDLDGDGVPEIAVGARASDDAAQDAGKVYVYSGADLSLLLTSVGVDEAMGVGSDVAPAGDVDGDGTPDLAVMTGTEDPGLLLLRGVPVPR